MKPAEKLTALQRYIEKTKRQLDMESRPEMRAFLQREIIKADRVIEYLKMK